MLSSCVAINGNASKFCDDDGNGDDDSAVAADVEMLVLLVMLYSTGIVVSSIF